MRPLNLLAAFLTTGILVAVLHSTLEAASTQITYIEQTDGLTGAATAVAPRNTAAAASSSVTETASATAPAATRSAVKTMTPPAPQTGALAALPTSTPVAATQAGEPQVLLTTGVITGAPAAASSVAATATTPLSATVAGQTAALPPPETGPVEGTVVANRTTSLVRFFVDGMTYSLDPLRSTGLSLTRATSVLNLFNCDATGGEQQEGCFWDPYLLRKDSFYEIVNGKDAGALVSLILREAGAPPDNQVWIQNRTGRAEEVYFGTQMRPIEPAGIEEFAVESGGVGVFYLRTCVVSGEESVCEWTAHSAQPGSYYALTEDSWNGGPAGSTVVNLELKPILGAAEEGSAATQQPQTVCRLAVPALNVRSGPGLGFEIVKKVRSSENEVATVIVTGRTEGGDWLKVDERIATSGWVIAGNEYLTCDGDVFVLPVLAQAEPVATPTPEAVVMVAPAAPIVETAPLAPVEVAPVEVPAGDASPAPGDDAPLTETTTVTASAPAGPTVRPGLALLTVQNSFDRDMRFTLDQRYRADPGPSEFDLAPGQAVSIAVFPGVVPFTASSPWQGLSGNDDVHIEAEQAKSLYLYFSFDDAEQKWLLFSAE